jgi:competence protein ComGC
MNKKGVTDYVLLLIIIIIISVVLVIFYLIIFSPSTLSKILPIFPNPFG